MNTRNQQPEQENEFSLATREETAPGSVLPFSDVLYGWFPAAIKQLYHAHGLPYEDDYYDFEKVFADHLKVITNPLSLLAALVILNSKCHLKMNHDMLRPVLISTLDEIAQTEKVTIPMTQMSALICQLAPAMSSDAVSLLLAQLHKWYFYYRQMVNYPKMCTELLYAVGVPEKRFGNILRQIEKHHLVHILDNEDVFLQGFYITMVNDGYFKPNSVFQDELSPGLLAIVAKLDDLYLSRSISDEVSKLLVPKLFDLEQGYLLRHYYLYSQLNSVSRTQYAEQPALRGRLYKIISTLYQTGLGSYFIDLANNKTWGVRGSLLRSIEGFIHARGKETVEQTLEHINQLAKQYFISQGLSAADIEKAPNLVNAPCVREIRSNECHVLFDAMLDAEKVDTEEQAQWQQVFSASLTRLTADTLSSFLQMMKTLGHANTSFSLKVAINIVAAPSYLPYFTRIIESLDRADLLTKMTREDFVSIAPAIQVIPQSSRLAIVNDEERFERFVHLILAKFVERLLASGRCEVDDAGLKALCDLHFIDTDLLINPVVDEVPISLIEAMHNLISSGSNEADVHSIIHETSAAKRLRIA